MRRLVPPAAVGVLVAAASACSPGEDQPKAPGAKKSAIPVHSQAATTVSPRPAHPSDAIRITFPTPYSVGDVPRYGDRPAQTVDNYHVIFRGPGGRDCRPGGFRFAVGYLTEKRRQPRRTVVVKRPGLQSPARHNENWCLGRFSGHVEYRQPDQRPFERLGTFAFTVEP